MDGSAARAVIDANRYMTLATADASGRPWASPVWFASIDHREFFWVSSPRTRHSQNIAVRPDIAIVMFDSHEVQGPAAGKAVYLSAVAEEVPEVDLDRGLAVFSEVSRRQGLSVWARHDVVPPARHRLYRATATEWFVLTDTDERQPIDMAEEQ
jgi:nitroimidazol reductase NimA-like FMN-containing flavoprotein (pyridoxamine 5'-phosphate oxidase superfamily)